MSDVAKKTPGAGNLTDAKLAGFFEWIDTLRLKLRDVNSVMFCLKCVDDSCDPLILQELPFAIGMMEKEIEKVMDDLDDLSRIGGACVKAGRGMDDVLLEFGPM